MLPASAVAAAALVVLVVQDPSRFTPVMRAVDPQVAGFELQADAQLGPAGPVVSTAPVDSPSHSRRSVPTNDVQIASAGALERQGQFGALLRELQVNARTHTAGGWSSAPEGRVHRVMQPVPSSRGRVATARTGTFDRAGSLARVSGASARSAASEDPRDEWLARGLADPVGFAHFLGTKNLAEQELWVGRLGQRAQERGLLDELVATLRASGDVAAAVLSDDFAARAAAAVGTTGEVDAGETTAEAPFDH